jgi:hypothetical protein
LWENFNATTVTSQGDERKENSETTDKYKSKTNKGNFFVGNGSFPKISLLI